MAALKSAIENLEQMRADEGRAMAADLRVNCQNALESLDRIAGKLKAVLAGKAA